MAGGVILGQLLNRRVVSRVSRAKPLPVSRSQPARLRLTTVFGNACIPTSCIAKPCVLIVKPSK